MRIGRVNFKIGRSLNEKQPLIVFLFVDSTQFERKSNYNTRNPRETLQKLKFKIKLNILKNKRYEEGISGADLVYLFAH